MKKYFCMLFALLVGIVFFSQTVFAAEPDGTELKRFKPSISMGYAYFGQTDLVLETKNVPLLGAYKLDVDIPGKSGAFIAGDFSFSFTDRLNLTVGGRIANAWSKPDVREEYNWNPGIGRTWDSDRQYWASADVLLAYAFVKNVSFVKNISGIVGLHADYLHVRMNNPRLASGVATGPSDEIKFDMTTVSPVIGVSSTLQGFRSGIFGGDIKVGLSASPVTSGRIKYKETFNSLTQIEADDNFYRAAAISVQAEVTAITAKIGPKADLLVSLYGQYTRSFIDSEIEVEATGSPKTDFQFSMQPSMAIVGVKAAIEF